MTTLEELGEPGTEECKEGANMPVEIRPSHCDVGLRKIINESPPCRPRLPEPSAKRLNTYESATIILMAVMELGAAALLFCTE